MLQNDQTWKHHLADSKLGYENDSVFYWGYWIVSYNFDILFLNLTEYS